MFGGSSSSSSSSSAAAPAVVESVVPAPAATQADALMNGTLFTGGARNAGGQKQLGDLRNNAFNNVNGAVAQPKDPYTDFALLDNL